MDKDSGLEHFDLLKLRLSLIIVRYRYTFLNTVDEFAVKLNQIFKVEYDGDEIKMALMQLEENLIHEEIEIIHIPEDFKV